MRQPRILVEISQVGMFASSFLVFLVLALGTIASLLLEIIGPLLVSLELLLLGILGSLATSLEAFLAASLAALLAWQSTGMGIATSQDQAKPPNFPTKGTPLELA